MGFYARKVPDRVLKAIVWMGRQVEEGGIEGSVGWPGWEEDLETEDGPEAIPWMQTYANDLIEAGKWAEREMGRQNGRFTGS